VTCRARAGLEAFHPKFESLDLPEPLTKKEIEVLSLMTAGSSNKEIAESMGVAEETIKHTPQRFLQDLACGTEFVQF